MMLFQKCPTCGHELVEKEVEKLLRGGVHTAVVKVQVDVCQHCGERLYSPDTVKRFEEIRAKLERQETGGFRQVGQSFQVGSSSSASSRLLKNLFDHPERQGDKRLRNDKSSSW